MIKCSEFPSQHDDMQDEQKTVEIVSQMIELGKILEEDKYFKSRGVDEIDFMASYNRERSESYIRIIKENVKLKEALEMCQMKSWDLEVVNRDLKNILSAYDNVLANLRNLVNQGKCCVCVVDKGETE